MTAAEPQLTGLPPGSRLVEAVAVMDRLRSPGGCPWDAEQTHASLGRYLVEECYELLQAIEDGDPAAMREELGDVLLQVLFHARIAQQDGAASFDIDDVAQTLIDKLVRRHPHVFGVAENSGTAGEAEKPGTVGEAEKIMTAGEAEKPGTVGEAEKPVGEAEKIMTAGDQQLRWDELKRKEAGRTSVISGVALGQPAVALAAKLGARSAKFDVSVALPAGEDIGSQLFRLAFQAGARGEDPETALRDIARAHAAELAAAEQLVPEPENSARVQ